MFSDLKSLVIPEGEVTKITAGGVVLWEKITMLPHNDLVPTGINTDGTILDGIGYRLGAFWNSTRIDPNDAFTAIGAMPFDGTSSHDIYVYGLNFSGTAYNKFILFDSAFTYLNGAVGVTDGTTVSGICTVQKLAENYYKITTGTFSTRVKYFAISGVTVDGVTPIVTLDQPIIEVK